MNLRSSLLSVVGLGLAVTLLSGCWIVSVHPLYTDDTLAYDERLVGIWNADGATLVVLAAGDKKYGVQYTDTSPPIRKTTLLEAQLVKLGDQLYLDVYPSPEVDAGDEAAHRIAVHSFWRVSLDADKLNLTPIDSDWLDKQLEKDAATIRTAPLRRATLLTASTAELQEFIRRYDKQAFQPNEEAAWHRQPATKKD